MITLTRDELDALVCHTAAISRAVRAIEDAVTDTQQGSHYPTVRLSLAAVGAILTVVRDRAAGPPGKNPPGPA